MTKPIRRRKPKPVSQPDFFRSLQAQFPEVASQLQPAIDRGGLQRCLLCGDPVVWLGCFSPGRDPEDHRLWGARPGKFRNWFYGLCEVCFHRPGVQVEVEVYILAEVKAGKVRWN